MLQGALHVQIILHQVGLLEQPEDAEVLQSVHGDLFKLTVGTDAFFLFHATIDIFTQLLILVIDGDELSESVIHL